jgi:LPS sulfotransferase NodH
MRIVARDSARWRLYFARNGIDPLRLEYEQILADPQGAANAVAAFMGVDPPPPIDPSSIDLTILRDEISAEWRRRFVAERGNSQVAGDGNPAWALRAWFRRARRRLDPFAVRRDPRDWP